ncbi:MAG TPA: hypothetical protein VNO55_01375, partial [Polyangia bacterium]|nr:hypothetical protein [Polyangia bacterium]
GQTEAFRSAHRRFVVERRPEFETSRRRLGVHAERGFLQHTPTGDLAIVIFEVDDPARMFAGVSNSDEPLDADFRAYLRRVFGLDVTRPPPSPPAESVFEWRAG